MNRIAICSFCNSKYEVRPQVKNPIACKKKECQFKRQRKNEKDWRLRNQGLYDAKYHKIQRQERKKKLKVMSEEILKMIKIGQVYLGEKLNLVLMHEVLEKFIYNFGIRHANKLWNVKKGLEINMLEEVFVV